MTTATTVEALLQRMPVFPAGHVWLAGAGPGDPALLTLGAVSGLAQADVVVHDALVDSRILDLAPANVRRVFAGKRGGRPSPDQADISAQLVMLAQQGQRVLRLKGGDPYVFGRGAEEVLTLAEHGIPFRVIPGITSGLAGLTMSLMPTTMRGVNRAIVLATGQSADDIEHGDGLDWAAISRLGQPIVLYMAVGRLAAISQALVSGGMSRETPAAAIVSATLADQRVLVSTVGDIPAAIAEAGLGTPAIVVIGEIVRLRERLLGLMPELAREALTWLSG